MPRKIFQKSNGNSRQNPFLPSKKAISTKQTPKASRSFSQIKPFFRKKWLQNCIPSYFISSSRDQVFESPVPKRAPSKFEAFRSASKIVCTYRLVVESWLWPSRAATVLILVPLSSKSVALVWRSAWNFLCRIPFRRRNSVNHLVALCGGIGEPSFRQKTQRCFCAALAFSKR